MLCLMIGKVNVDLSTRDLLRGLEGHALLDLGTTIFCEIPTTTSRSLTKRTEIRRIWEKFGGKGIPKVFSGIGGRKLLEA